MTLSLDFLVCSWSWCLIAFFWKSSLVLKWREMGLCHPFIRSTCKTSGKFLIPRPGEKHVIQLTIYQCVLGGLTEVVKAMERQEPILC